MNKAILIGLAGLVLSCRSGNHFAAGDPLPSFSMMAVDSSLFSSDQLTGNVWTVFMYFRPDCPHCQQQTADILKNTRSLQNINIIFLTSKPLADLRRYAAFFDLGGFANIRAASDYRRQFKNYYRPENVPFLVIYRNRQLYRIYDGRVPVDSLTALNRIP